MNSDNQPEVDLNRQDEEDVERLLMQMSLEKPSRSLDDSVFALTRSAAVAKDVHPRFRFGWPAMISTAIAASLMGVLIGRLVPPFQWNELESQPTATSTLLTPVALRDGPRIVDEGFLMLDGVRPARVYRLERSQKSERSAALPVRRKIVVPSPEI